MTAQHCPQCQALNPPDAEHCSRCSAPLRVVGAAPAPSGFSEGLMITPNYRLVRAIGEGGMGQVWEALQVSVDRPVAIKFLHPELMRHPTAKERVLKEAVTLGRVDHRNVVRIIECFETSNSVALVLEYIKDGSLCDRIERQGAFDWQDAVRLIDGVLKGLGALHRSGIIHRDMKPDNVLLSIDHDGEETPKVTDLGIAHDEAATRLTRDGSRLGTPEYMSPEQVRGQAVDSRSDLYSTGILLYEMLIGEVPFSGTDYDIMHGHASQAPNLDKLPPQVPDWLRNALAVSMAKNPEDRFQTYGEFRDALSSDSPVDTSRIPQFASPAMTTEVSTQRSASPPSDDNSINDPYDLAEEKVKTERAWSLTTKGLNEIRASLRVAGYGLMVHLVTVFIHIFLVDYELEGLTSLVRNILFVIAILYAMVGTFRLTMAPTHVKGREVAWGAFISMCLVPILLFYEVEEMSNRRTMEFELFATGIALGASWLFLTAFFVRMGDALDEESLNTVAVSLRNLIIGAWFIPIGIAAYSEYEYAQPIILVCCIALVIRQADLLQLGTTHTNLLSGEW